MFRQLALVASVYLTSTAAFAQTAMPAGLDSEIALEAANNQLGILKYCEAQGYTGAEAIAAQEKIIAMMPTGDAVKAAAAIAKGEEGIVVVDGNEIVLKNAADQQGITLEAQCQQIEDAINKTASQLPQ